jgi:hypothetical protein
VACAKQPVGQLRTDPATPNDDNPHDSLLHSLEADGR